MILACVVWYGVGGSGWGGGRGVQVRSRGCRVEETGVGGGGVRARCCQVPLSPVKRIAHTCENMTFPRTTCVVCKNFMHHRCHLLFQLFLIIMIYPVSIIIVLIFLITRCVFNGLSRHHCNRSHIAYQDSCCTKDSQSPRMETLSEGFCQRDVRAD